LRKIEGTGRTDGRTATLNAVSTL